MANGVRLKINARGVGDVALRGGEVRGLIGEMTGRIADAARSSADEPDWVHSTVAGTSRARGYVGMLMHEETHHARLSQAIGAAR
jgi:hypothetical protein